LEVVGYLNFFWGGDQTLFKFRLFNAIENILKIIQLNGSQSPSPPFFLWSLNNNNDNNDNFKVEESNYFGTIISILALLSNPITSRPC
jgi:hypothetical protein